MRIRALFVACALFGSLAPANASQIAAVEVRSNGFNPSTRYATRTITQSGALFVFDSGLSLSNSPFLAYGTDAFPPSFFPEFGFDSYVFNQEAIFCYYSQGYCGYDGGLSETGRTIHSIAQLYGFFPTLYIQWRSCSADWIPFNPPPACTPLAVPPSYPAWGTYPFSSEVRATAINNADLIVGYARSGISGVDRVPVWWPTPFAVSQELPRFSGLDSGPYPVGVSDVGVIVGVSGGATTPRAAIWKPAAGGGYSLAYLGELPGGTSSRPLGIGFFGKAVGSSNGGSASQVAVVWTPTAGGYTVTPLPVPPGGSCSAATAINVYQDIVGNCLLAGGEERGVLWQYVGPGDWEILHQLEPLPGENRSVAFALSNDGQAGGASGPEASQRPVLWSLAANAPTAVPALSPNAYLLLGTILAGTAVRILRRR